MRPISRDCRSRSNRCRNYSYGSEQRRRSRCNGCRSQQAPRDDHDSSPNHDHHHITPANNDNHYYHDRHYHDDVAATRRAV